MDREGFRVKLGVLKLDLEGKSTTSAVSKC